jgi:hypothetical protein
MPPSYCFVLLCITLYYFVLLCIWLHSEPYRYYGPYTLWPLRHALCHHCMEFWSLGEHVLHPTYLQFCSLRGICYAIITCSFWAHSTYHIILHSKPFMPYGPETLWPPRHVPYPHHMQSCRLGGHEQCLHYMQFWSMQGICHAIIHAIAGPMTYMPGHHYMQFQSLWGTCHGTSTCKSGVKWADAIPSLNAISELLKHMQCPQLSLHTDLYSFILLHITSYLIAQKSL